MQLNPLGYGFAINFTYVKCLKSPMDEFFRMLDHNTAARIFIFCEVWLSFILGYIIGRWDKKNGGESE